MIHQIIQNRLATNKPKEMHTIPEFFRKQQPKPPLSTNSYNLLKTAYQMLEKADLDLKAKDQRIKSLENIITKDELTGLTNRRGFYEALKKEIDLTNRGINKGGVVIMIDLDYFKNINDSFGHLAGDEALKIVGYFLQNAVRKMDIAARIGGDEFIILFSNTTITKSMKRAKKLGQDLNNLSFEWQGKTIDIRASLGLKEYGQGDTIETVIEAADQGMYQDKIGKKPTMH